MRKLLWILSLLCLSGCSTEKLHHCKMDSDPYIWEIEYETNKAGEVLAMKQMVSVNAKDEEEKEAYMKLLDEVFETYQNNYQGACQFENQDQALLIQRIITINFDKLTDEQKEEMSFESEEVYLKAQLEYAGYTCD